MTITHQQAERIAQAVTTLRPDWLASSVTTLILRDLTTWPLIDIACGLTYVALDLKPDGSWASRTPGRVKEQGPWRHVGVVDPELERSRRQTAEAAGLARQAAATRISAAAGCDYCDDQGRLPNSNMCSHDNRSDPDYRSPGAARARAALAAARTARQEPTPA